MIEYDYNLPERLLHRLALRYIPVLELSFKLEKTLFRNKLSLARGPHVFVAGLARSGTTIIMRALYATDLFRSLTYRDMPFVLANNLWQLLSKNNRQDIVSRERAHRDGIKVTPDSPEAFEEIFWRMITEENYIRDDSLVPHTVSDKQLEEFRTFIDLILYRCPQHRYLSKNNNNILRLKAIQKAFPDASVLIPFRDPVQQACSLLKQHRHFFKVHEDNPFALAYMNWLAHHEFGAGHRPFKISADPCPKPEDTLSYWLCNWINVYKYVAREAPENAIWISYERLCSSTDSVWSSLDQALDLDSPECPVDMKTSNHSVEYQLNPDLVGEANTLYKSLLTRSI